jgi:S1-C subfamily serine protease
MPIHVVCPGCRTPYDVPDDLEGKKIRCKHCDQPVPVVAKPKLAAKTMSPDERTQSSPRKLPPRSHGDRDAEDDRDRRGRDDDDRSRRKADRDHDEDRHSRRRSERDEESERIARRKSRSRREAGNSGILMIVGGIVGGLVLVGIVVGVVWWAWRRADPQKDPVFNTQNRDNMIGPRGGPPIVVIDPNGELGGGGGDNNKQLDKAVLDKVKPATVYIGVGEGVHRSSGSGFLAFEPGIVLTNAHVVGMLEPGTERPDKVIVHVNHGQANERKLQAEIMGVDRSHDLAVLKIPAAGLPSHLEVKASQELVETQPVYICGYPLGDLAGREVTISGAQVTALRKNRHGRLEHVQIKGDMKPGNSGGPVIDEKGNVVGVSVAIIVGTRINFAVPAEYVHDIINGRLLEVGMGQSYYNADRVRVPVNMEMMNPAGRIDKVAVDVWIGDDDKYQPPPTRDNPPPQRPGDTPRQRYRLDSAFNGARGEMTLPGNLERGKVYYWQPVLTYKDGKVVYPMGARYVPDIPVHRRPANLVFRNHPGAREVFLQSSMSFQGVGAEGDEGKMVRAMKTKMVEKTGPVKADGSATVNLEVQGLDLSVTVEGKPLEDEDKKEIQRIKDNGVFLRFQLEVDGQGNLKSNRGGAFRAPDDVKETLNEMAEELQTDLESISVTLPNREVAPGDHWPGRRKMMVRTTGRGQGGDMEITYTYLGRRNRNGRDEALIELGGLIRKEGATKRMGGRVGGRALIDLETGIISIATSTITLNVDTNRHEVKVKYTGVVEVRIERALPPKRQ